MSARRKTPTADDNKRTAIFESGKHRRPGAAADFPDQVDPTVVDGPLAQSLLESPAAPDAGPTIRDAPSHAAPTVLGKSTASVRTDRAPIQAISNREPSAPIQVISKKQASSAPIQAISMKNAGAQRGPVAAEPNPPTPVLPRPKLRAMSEITPVKQQNLGHVAPPYDPAEARARQVREYVIWGCVAVMLASAIALVVWFVAR